MVEHRPVVLLGVLRNARVLFGVEVLVLRRTPIETHVLLGAAAELHQRLHDFRLTRLRQP